MNMKALIKMACVAIVILFSPWLQAAGLLKPTASHLPDLDIKEHHVTVVIEDSYVTTTIEQTFHNPHSQNLEAIYSFPVPTLAAVGEFTYWINGQPVTGEVIEKAKAKQLYAQEKAAGRHVAIVEKEDYKRFDIRVAAVKALSEVKIRLVYIQPASIDTGVGRYVYPLENGGVDEEQRAFWSRNEVVTEKFSFDLRFRSSYPLDALRLPNHPHASIQQLSPQEWQLSLKNTALVKAQHMEEGDAPEKLPATTANKTTLSADIVVYWRHQQGLPGSLDIVTYKPAADKRGTFMLTLTPGDDLAKMTGGRDWVFVLDVSGSMQGKYATLVEGVRQGMGKLRADDRYKVVVFNRNAVALTNGFHAVNKANVDNTLQQLEQYPVDGGTNLYAGLKRGLTGLDADRSAGIILVTDGVANVGVTEKKAFLNMLRQHDVRLFTFIMGNSANRPLLKEMTAVSNGFAMSVSNADDIVGHIMLATSKLSHQAFRNVSLDIDGVRVSDLSPEKIGSLYRGEQLSIFGHYWQPGTAKVVLTATVGGDKKRYNTTIDFADIAENNPEIERLWAVATIEQLQSAQDYLGADKDSEQAIVDIAIEYGLVTDYTSMIVVEEAVFNANHIERSSQRRVEKENKAREQRQAQPLPRYNKSPSQGMFQNNRPSNSGSGAVNPLWLILMLAVLMLPYVCRYQRQTA